MHLALFRIADADNGFLDQSGGIFPRLEPRPRQGEENGSACLPKFERRLRVAVDEDLFDRRPIGLVLEDQIRQFPVNLHEPIGQAVFAVG